MLFNSITHGKIKTAKITPRLFFLCGANRSNEVISIRRERVKNFVEDKIDNATVVIAEVFFKNFIHNHRDAGLKSTLNSLDFENVLTEISEKVLIILESNSSFCELGAFAHENLRQKLIVINDSKHQYAESFINTGPLKAISESTSAGRVIWYNMSPNGIHNDDSIASTFIDLEKVIGTEPDKLKGPIRIDPSERPITLHHALFIHDLIYFCNGLTYKKLVNILIALFGKKPFHNLAHIIAILTSLNLVKYIGSPAPIESLCDHSFLNYGGEHEKILRGFRLNSLKDRMRS